MVRRARAFLPVIFLALSACSQPEPDSLPGGAGTGEPAVFVGGAACSSCHAGVYADWSGSHHDRAMQRPAEDSVLGDFADARYERDGRFYEFSERAGEYFVQTNDVGGAGPREFPVAYTFGAEPLQQYLVQTSGGRLQALSVAWDSRGAEAGGQRWFDLADESTDAADVLHWTGPLYNWNGRCADCHSTALKKNYVVEDDRFETSFASVDVDCEACHGPGSAHVADPSEPMLLGEVERAWTFEPGASIAALAGGARAPVELQTCAACHARRSQMTDGEVGAALLDAYQPSLLTEGLYHADGQIDDEVFVYGSFLQSAMHAAGVGCVDCHEPHTGGLVREGNALCAGCHLPTVYDTPEHRRHEATAAGSQCVDCHMPAETYMRVDPRRDHSFRVPRPDLTAAIGTPNACNGCHRDETADWAARAIAGWTSDAGPEPHFGLALAAGRRWDGDRAERLRAVIDDLQAPGIVRATALRLLARQADDALPTTIGSALDSNDALLRLAALTAVEAVPAERRRALAQRFLDDPLRAFRIESARVLLPVRGELSDGRRRDFDAALAEYLAAQAFNAETAEARLNIATVHDAFGRVEEAEASLLASIEANPAFAPAYVNLADLYRRTGREEQGLALLLEAERERVDADAGLASAIGFSLVRLDRAEESIDWFARARERAPDDPYHAYVYGVSLNSTAGGQSGIEVLEAAYERFPGNASIPFALATMYRDGGQYEQALRFARALRTLDAASAQWRALEEEIEAALRAR